MIQDTPTLLNRIAQTIYDKKGMNILVLDVRGISSITDYIVVAEGNVDRHVKALSNAIHVSLKEEGHQPLFVEGKTESEWVVMDYEDVIIHLFTPELRHKYGIEQIWQEGKVVDTQIELQSSQA